MIVYRQAPPGVPFLWESARQPPGRWHGEGEGPAQYFSTTPDGAWAELIRHEEITDPADLREVRRAVWAVDIGDADPGLPRPDLDERLLRGGLPSYRACQTEARRLREEGARGLRTVSAALEPGPSGHRVEGGLLPGPDRQEEVVVLFGARHDLVGWLACVEGRPDPGVLPRVRRLRRGQRIA